MALYLGVVQNGSFISSDGAFVTSDGYVLQDSNGLNLYATIATDGYKIIIDNVIYRVNVNLPDNMPSTIKESE